MLVDMSHSLAFPGLGTMLDKPVDQLLYAAEDVSALSLSYVHIMGSGVPSLSPTVLYLETFKLGMGSLSG